MKALACDACADGFKKPGPWHRPRVCTLHEPTRLTTEQQAGQLMYCPRCAGLGWHLPKATPGEPEHRRTYVSCGACKRTGYVLKLLPGEPRPWGWDN